MENKLEALINAVIKDNGGNMLREEALNLIFIKVSEDFKWEGRDLKYKGKIFDSKEEVQYPDIWSREGKEFCSSSSWSKSIEERRRELFPDTPEEGSLLLDFPPTLGYDWSMGLSETSGNIYEAHEDAYNSYLAKSGKYYREAQKTRYDEELKAWEDTDILSLELLREATFYQMDLPLYYPEHKEKTKLIFKEVTELNNLLTSFQEKMWETNIVPYYEKEKMRSHSGHMNGTKVMLYGIAGRLLLQISRGEDSMSIIGEDRLGGNKIGISRIETSKDKALKMMFSIMECGESFKDHMKPDSEVRLAGT